MYSDAASPDSPGAREADLVSGFGFRVSGFGFQVSGFGFRGSGSGLREPSTRAGVKKVVEPPSKSSVKSVTPKKQPSGCYMGQ